MYAHASRDRPPRATADPPARVTAAESRIMAVMDPVYYQDDEYGEEEDEPYSLELAHYDENAYDEEGEAEEDETDEEDDEEQQVSSVQNRLQRQELERNEAVQARRERARPEFSPPLPSIPNVPWIPTQRPTPQRVAPVVPTSATVPRAPLPDAGPGFKDQVRCVRPTMTTLTHVNHAATHTHTNRVAAPVRKPDASVTTGSTTTSTATTSTGHESWSMEPLAPLPRREPPTTPPPPRREPLHTSPPAQQREPLDTPPPPPRREPLTPPPTRREPLETPTVRSALSVRSHDTLDDASLLPVVPAECSRTVVTTLPMATTNPGMPPSSLNEPVAVPVPSPHDDATPHARIVTRRRPSEEEAIRRVQEFIAATQPTATHNATDRAAAPTGPTVHSTRSARTTATEPTTATPQRTRSLSEEQDILRVQRLIQTEQHDREVAQRIKDKQRKERCQILALSAVLLGMVGVFGGIVGLLQSS